MVCEVKYFGMISEKLNRTSDLIHLENDLLFPEDLKRSFVDKFPELSNMTFKVAVDGVITNSVSSNDVQTIALLPPFAGG
jgi:hypothetical protein